MSPGPCWSIPTKMMLAGEYGVLVPGGRALALAASPRLLVSRDPYWGTGLVELTVPRLLEAAVRQTLPGLQDRVDLQPRLRAWFHPEPGPGPVGTSAALAAGVTLSLAVESGLDSLSLPEVAEFAAQAHSLAQGGGSGYDVFTSMLGEVVDFSAAGNQGAPRTAICLETIPGLRVVAAWSGVKAVTRELLAALASIRAQSSGQVEELLQELNSAGTTLIEELKKGSFPRVAEVRQGFGRLDQMLGGRLLPPPVTRLLALGDDQGIPVKVSGAGGGDWVIGFPQGPGEAELLVKTWTAGGFPAKLLAAECGALLLKS